MSAAVAWDDTIAPARVPGRPRLHLVPTGDAVPARAPRRLRFTRRGRLAMTLTVAVLVAVAAFSAWSSLATAAPAGAATHVVTVESGQSLSEIAAREMPGVRTDDAVLRLVKANHLQNDQIMTGQTLVVPAS